MTLDEAIKHCEEVAETQKNNCDYGEDHYTRLKASTCAAEHYQLAEWLKELKKLRKQAKKRHKFISKMLDMYDSLLGEE